MSPRKIILIGALALAGLTAYTSHNLQGTPLRPLLKATVASYLPAPQRISMLDYGLLSDGISYDMAKTLLHGPGRELSRCNTPELGMTTVAYSWQNANGSNVQLIFQNDRLVIRAQAGLPEA